MGFVPNRAARGLITGRTGNVAAIVPDITNPHFAALVRSVERAARESDLQVLLVDTGEHPEEEVRAATTLAREVDGFIVISARRLHRHPGALDGKPAVFVNRRIASHASVVFRTAPAVGDALRHLEGLGHRIVAYLGGPSTSWAAGERRGAVRRAATRANMHVLEFAVPSPTFEAAVSIAPRVAACHATAVIAFNDQMALGVIAGVGRLGISVPGQISVIGFDDVPMAAMVAPPLTTIGMPTEEAGILAVQMLSEPPSKKELLGTLVLRASTGPVTGRHATSFAGDARQTSGVDRG